MRHLRKPLDASRRVQSDTATECRHQLKPIDRDAVARAVGVGDVARADDDRLDAVRGEVSTVGPLGHSHGLGREPKLANRP